MAKSFFIYIPGTVLPVASSIVKPIVSTFIQPQLFTPRSTSKLIRIKEPNPSDCRGIFFDTAPSGCRQFEALYEHIPEEQRYYFQWSGNLGETVWQENAGYLHKRLQAKMKDDKEELEIVIVAHSHGGQIARKLAELFKDMPSVKFKIITVATPLNEKIKMPNNVEVWQHFYHKKDKFQALGSLLMEPWSTICTPWSYTAKRDMKSTQNPKYQSHVVNLELADPHNDLIKDERSVEFICQTVKPLIPGFADERKERKSTRLEA